ncbi:MAG: MotA/TolQ/ExbB proton channel family protein [Planctomycetota bacterium]
MDLEQVMWLAGIIDYIAIGVVAFWGVFCVILLFRQIGRRRFKSENEANDFLDELRENLRRGDFDGAEQLCTSREYWYRAVAVLTQGAIEKRHLGLAKVKQLLATRFEGQILSELENLIAWINTVAKSAPMLGLFGTVVGMIGAFSQIAGVEHPDPGILADNIAVALNTTALGLTVAIPMIIAANFIQVRMRRLEDATVEQMQEVIDALEPALAAGRSKAHAG